MLPIRRLLLRDLLVLMAGVSALILGLAWWTQQQALGRQAAARTQFALRHLNEVLRLELEASQSLGQIVREWWRDGVLDPTRPGEAARLVLPLLSVQRGVTSLNLARADGRSLLFLRQGDVWSMRELIHPGSEARIRWHRLGRPEDTAMAGPWIPMDYDPRTRPWYQVGAAAQGPAWTEPYAFYTTQDPGITCTFPVRGADGLRGVAALDFLLDDLTARIWSAQPTPRSRCLVVDALGRVLILPNDPAFQTMESRRKAFLKPLGLGFLEAQSGLLGLSKPLGETLSFSHRGEAMVGLVKAFEPLPGIHWRLLMTVPEADLLGPARLRIWSLLGMAILSLGLAAWRIRHIARRVAGPISQLGAAAILGQLHLCREMLPEGHSVLGRIQRAEDATRRCAQTTKALLSFSHQSRPELRRVDLNALVQDTAAILERVLGGRIRLLLSLAPELAPVSGDAVQLEQVLMNLGVNARDAMPGGGTLSLTTRQLEDGQILLEIQDTGTGIPAAILSSLFEPFVTTKEPGKGTGLGLAMAFSIMKAHRGEIRVENVPGGGALFRVVLPPAGLSATYAPREPADIRTAAPGLAGRRILVAEDELLLREMLADSLTLARMQVTTAPDGALAWEAWQQAGGFDLVLTDQRMPDCTGLELMALIRAGGSDVPVILISGQGLENVEDSLSKDRRVRILPKPFELPTLIRAMEQMLIRPGS